jgi:hypothetical protein
MTTKIDIRDCKFDGEQKANGIIYDSSSQRDERDDRRAFWAYATALVCGAGFWGIVGFAFARSRGWL